MIFSLNSNNSVLQYLGRNRLMFIPYKINQSVSQFNLISELVKLSIARS
jgi:hypothetical protein